MATTGTTPAESLLVVQPLEPIWPPTVCDADTETGPSAKPLTSMAAVAQMPLLHTADAVRPPISTSTLAPSAEQVPETV